MYCTLLYDTAENLMPLLAVLVSYGDLSDGSH